MRLFLKRFFQLTIVLFMCVVGYFVLMQNSSTLSIHEVALKCTLNKATTKASGFYAKTIDSPREGKGGPSWTANTPALRIPAVDWLEIRNDWVRGQKLIRRVDAQGTERTGFTQLRGMDETPQKYTGRFSGSDWSTVFRIDRDDLEMKELIYLPSEYAEEWWTRKCIIVDGAELDEVHKSLFIQVKI